MSTRIYCDQCGTETSKRKALRFSLSGYSANRTSMGQLNDIEIDICPDCAPNDSTTRPSAPSTYAETTETSSAPTCSNTSPPI